jgi:hypothetical protein
VNQSCVEWVAGQAIVFFYVIILDKKCFSICVSGGFNFGNSGVNPSAPVINFNAETSGTTPFQFGKNIVSMKWYHYLFTIENCFPV